MSNVDTSGEERRRNKRWPEALKREIVAATHAPGASVSVVARQYDVNASVAPSFSRIGRGRDAGVGIDFAAKKKRTKRDVFLAEMARSHTCGLGLIVEPWLSSKPPLQGVPSEPGAARRAAFQFVSAGTTIRSPQRKAR
jgi:transposase-like protein